MSINIKDFFNNIRFLEETHQYLLNQEELKSVSSILQKVSPIFDVEKVSKKVALKEKVSPEEIQTIWRIRRELSIVRGTEFHLYAETYLNEERKIQTITPIEKELQQFHQFWDEKNKHQYKVIITEWQVYDLENKIAGTIDCLVQHQESGLYYILDWKTNRNLRIYNTYSQFLAPIEHLDNCEVNRYSLQTSFYKSIIEKNTPIKIESCYLVHFSKENDQYKVVPCLNFSKEINQILKSIHGKS